jgi:hypothetical protein
MYRAQVQINKETMIRAGTLLVMTDDKPLARDLARVFPIVNGTFSSFVKKGNNKEDLEGLVFS